MPKWYIMSVKIDGEPISVSSNMLLSSPMRWLYKYENFAKFIKNFTLININTKKENRSIIKYTEISVFHLQLKIDNN